MRAAMAQNRGDVARTRARRAELALRAVRARSATCGGSRSSKQMRAEWLALDGQLEEALRVSRRVDGRPCARITSSWDLQQQQGLGGHAAAAPRPRATRRGIARAAAARGGGGEPGRRARMVSRMSPTRCSTSSSRRGCGCDDLRRPRPHARRAATTDRRRMAGDPAAADRASIGVVARPHRAAARRPGRRRGAPATAPPRPRSRATTSRSWLRRARRRRTSRSTRGDLARRAPPRSTSPSRCAAPPTRPTAPRSRLRNAARGGRGRARLRESGCGRSTSDAAARRCFRSCGGRPRSRAGRRPRPARRSEPSTQSDLAAEGRARRPCTAVPDEQPAHRLDHVGDRVDRDPALQPVRQGARRARRSTTRRSAGTRSGTRAPARRPSCGRASRSAPRPSTGSPRTR